MPGKNADLRAAMFAGFLLRFFNSVLLLSIYALLVSTTCVNALTVKQQKIISKETLTVAKLLAK